MCSTFSYRQIPPLPVKVSNRKWTSFGGVGSFPWWPHSSGLSDCPPSPQIPQGCWAFPVRCLITLMSAAPGWTQSRPSCRLSTLPPLGKSKLLHFKWPHTPCFTVCLCVGCVFLAQEKSTKYWCAPPEPVVWCLRNGQGWKPCVVDVIHKHCDIEDSTFWQPTHTLNVTEVNALGSQTTVVWLRLQELCKAHTHTHTQGGVDTHVCEPCQLFSTVLNRGCARCSPRWPHGSASAQLLRWRRWWSDFLPSCSDSVDVEKCLLCLRPKSGFWTYCKYWSSTCS